MMENNLLLYNVHSTSRRGVNLLSCGKMTAGEAHRSQLKVYPNHSLTFVLKGRGRFSCRGKVYDVGKGEGFLISEGEIVSYSSCPEDPWEYMFVIFRGPDCKVLFDQIHISPEEPCFQYPQDEEMQKIFDNLLSSSKKDKAGGYDVAAYFFLLVSRLIKSEDCQHNNRRYVEEAISYVENNYHNGITITDVANHVHIDRSYLYRLFISEYKLSPKKYLEEYKLVRATELLERTELSVSDIAASSGYYDRAHFDRVFLSKYGVSPSVWRRLHQPLITDKTTLRENEAKQ